MKSQKKKNSINFILDSLFMTVHAMRRMGYLLPPKKGKSTNSTPPK